MVLDAPPTGASLLFFGANLVALTASILIGAGVLISNPRSFNARIFAGAVGGSACYVLGRLSYAVPPDAQVHFWFWPYLLILMNIGPGLLVILANSLFQEDERVPRWIIAAFVVQMTLSAINALGYIGRDSSVLQSAAFPLVVNWVFGALPIAMQVAFALLALQLAVRGWRVDLDESRRVLRRVFVILVGGVFFSVSLAELALVDSAYASRAPFDNVITVVLAVGYSLVALAVLRFDGRVLERLVDRTPHSPKPGTDPGFERDLAQLTRALEEDKVFLTPGLSIKELATRLGVPEYRLRALINKRLGYRNFNAFLHDYRLREACERLGDPASARLPILSIALDVGYQSITPFNEAFRDAIGCTPSEYRQLCADPAWTGKGIPDSWNRLRVGGIRKKRRLAPPKTAVTRPPRAD